LLPVKERFHEPVERRTRFDRAETATATHATERS
jgi:hypothetical protein